MLKDRKVLERFLKSKNEKIIFDTQKCIQLYNLCYDDFGIPRGEIADIVASRIDISCASEFMLFAMLHSYDIIEEVNTSRLNEYFTKIEIDSFSKSRYEVDKIKFPLIFDMIQVANDQWIGVISVKEILELRKAQLINYDVNTQRTMQRVVLGKKESWKIKLNGQAVSSISTLMKNDQYIPNTLTLNIPPESDSNFYYDKDKKQLVITKLQYFNISDGYHRYIAISQVSEKDEDFNLSMELRITNFYNDKVQNFVFQEDQKTKMSKIDSDSFNTNNPANIIATRLNDDPRSNIKGMVGRNEAIIPMQEFAKVIDYFYVDKTTSRAEQQRSVIKTTKELIEDFNILTEEHPEILEKRLDFKTICCIIYIFKLYQDKDKSNMCKAVEYLLGNVHLVDKKKFVNKTVRKPMVNDFNKIMKGVEF